MNSQSPVEASPKPIALWGAKVIRPELRPYMTEQDTQKLAAALAMQLDDLQNSEVPEKISLHNVTVEAEWLAVQSWADDNGFGEQLAAFPQFQNRHDLFMMPEVTQESFLVFNTPPEDGSQGRDPEGENLPEDWEPMNDVDFSSESVCDVAEGSSGGDESSNPNSVHDEDLFRAAPKRPVATTMAIRLVSSPGASSTLEVDGLEFMSGPSNVVVDLTIEPDERSGEGRGPSKRRRLE
ncbi:hypothetical protein B0H63DRAFT_527065 [Podospora didyma]|uniref:Uncharacterized protein n=1 Tax=Podospora didyma TaxID=330526 RepID=A0AAE0N638_9PEZI|nr:hypothetical protein B0H63DRAFT_527065 [Podospora didyma]